ncbi:MAG: 3-phosphoshikimate 1-carboxyvinyltransferase, partial [Culturomica sp.]|nr:3-phosphoshikimate 1-carboxyvinyltransferase [Culturomica sp.]
VPFRFSGVETLRLKETDRTEALVRELRKLGYVLRATGDSVLSWQGETTAPHPHPEIETYHDHRMAMAFAPAALRFPGIVIRDATVVSKSFPAFWEEMRKLGLRAEKQQKWV